MLVHIGDELPAIPLGVVAFCQASNRPHCVLLPF